MSPVESSEPSAFNEKRLATLHKLTVTARAQGLSGRGGGRYPPRYAPPRAKGTKFQLLLQGTITMLGIRIKI